MTFRRNPLIPRHACSFRFLCFLKVSLREGPRPFPSMPAVAFGTSHRSRTPWLRPKRASRGARERERFELRFFPPLQSERATQRSPWTDPGASFHPLELFRWEPYPEPWTEGCDVTGKHSCDRTLEGWVVTSRGGHSCEVRIGVGEQSTRSTGAARPEAQHRAWHACDLREKGGDRHLWKHATERGQRYGRGKETQTSDAVACGLPWEGRATRKDQNGKQRMHKPMHGQRAANGTQNDTGRYTENDRISAWLEPRAEASILSHAPATLPIGRSTEGRGLALRTRKKQHRKRHPDNLYTEGAALL
eukprot:scaffold126_cov315-Pavlova_lutheri.AAC.9